MPIDDWESKLWNTIRNHIILHPNVDPKSSSRFFEVFGLTFLILEVRRLKFSDRSSELENRLISVKASGCYIIIMVIKIFDYVQVTALTDCLT